MQRERLGSRLGFILLSAGCAIGIGNVWKFPYVAGQFGGGIFVIIYLFFLISIIKSVPPANTLIFSSLLNVVLDLLFIGVFHFGVEGAAIATAISQILSALLAFIFLL